MTRQYSIQKDPLDPTDRVCWLFYGDDVVAEAFLSTEEETEEDFENGIYTRVCDLTYAENKTGEPLEDFFLTQDGCEAYRRTTELLPD